MDFSKKRDINKYSFFFISKKNAVNARNLPLFESTNEIRIVFLQGLPIRLLDRFILTLFRLLLHLFTRKISRYQTVHLFNTRYKFLSSKQVLHFDDPEYTESELNNLLRWENFCAIKGKIPIVICTNTYTYTWLTAKLVTAQVFIVEQGFHSLEMIDSKANANFSCVYTSPYIHYGNDKHAKHSTWGAELLIDQIIPRLNSLDLGVEIHLVGEIGKHASRELAKFKNVHIYGRVNFENNMKILTSCHIGIYPRTFDHKRSILKIFTYIGAGLPIVTFDLIDTEVVKLNSLGFAVGSVDEFIARILELKSSPDLLQKYRENIMVFRLNFTWSILAAKMENILAKT